MKNECAILVASCDKIDYDFSKRGFPPFKTRLVEGAKALVFRIVPNNWIVRVQNAFEGTPFPGVPHNREIW